MCLSNLFCELHGLQGQLSGGGQDESPSSTCLRGFQLLKHGHQEGGRLPAASPSHGYYIFAIQNHWYSLET